MHEPPSQSTSPLEAAPDHADAAQLRRELEAANLRAEEYADLLRQARADFAAHRRQLERERSDVAAQARIELLLRLLPIVEELQHCLALPPEDRLTAGWSSAVATLEQRLRGLLEGEGIEKIEAVGALYNPWEHEAVQRQSSPELEDHRVLAIVRDGYRIGDRVIRPAQVVVAQRAR